MLKPADRPAPPPSLAQVEAALRGVRGVAHQAWGRAAVAPAGLLAAEAILLSGARRFPSSPQPQLLLAAFCLDVLDDAPRCSAALERTLTLNPSLPQRFAAFAVGAELRRLRKERGAGDAISRLDLQAYVNVTALMAGVSKAHRGALRATRDVWRLLTRTDIVFKQLIATIAATEVTEERAAAAYRGALERYPRFSSWPFPRVLFMLR